MKFCALGLLAISLLTPRFAFAATPEEAARAAAIAEKQEQAERYRRMEANIGDLLAAQQEQQTRLNDQSRQIDALRDEIRRLRDELLKAGANAVTREDLKKITEAVSQVDERRVKDNRLLTDALEKLDAKLVLPEPPPATPPKKRDNPPAAAPDVGYWHTMAAGENVSVVVQAYRDQGVKVTLKQVMDANTGVDWNRLPIGKKIFIPDPNKTKADENPKGDEKP